MKFDVERMCRLNGKRPTARERWAAFYRLYRMSTKGHDIHAALECWDVLYADNRIDMLQSADMLGTRRGMPVFLRRRLIEGERYRRIYRGFYDYIERDKAVAHKLRGQGIEMTPLEVAEVRRKVIDKLRREWKGPPLPADDLTLWTSIKGVR